MCYFTVYVNGERVNLCGYFTNKINIGDEYKMKIH